MSSMKLIGKHSLSRIFLLLVLACTANTAIAQKKNTPKANSGASLSDAISDVYKKVGDTELKIYRFNPKDHQESDKRPTVVFFFGGGWNSGDPNQFANQCAYLAGRGMVAMTADYRVASRHKAKVVDCVEDAKSTIRWVRSNAEKLGIDPDRIVAGGGSAGGHLAACTGVVPGFECSTENAAISSIPNAMILFNPAVMLDNIDGEKVIEESKLVELRQRIGADPKRVSPCHHVKKGAPPTIVFHGKSDKTVPFRTVEIFAEVMKKNSNRCELIGYADKEHGFFNFGRDNNEGYQQTLIAMDQFLVSLGFLDKNSSESK